MPAVDEPHQGLLDDRGPAIAAAAGLFGQGNQHVELREHGGRALQSPGPGRHRVAQLQEQLIFKLLRFLVGREDFLFVFFQLGSDVAFGVLDRLLADVVGRNLGAVGIRDFDVIAEHLVEADLEAGDAGPRGLLGLIGGDPLLAPHRQVAQRVQLAAEAGPDEAPLAAYQRAFVEQGRFELAANVGAEVQFGLQLRQQRLRRAVILALICGSAASVRPTKLKSRGLARPVVTRASNLSKS